MNKEKHVPEWMLERYLLDELPRRERRRVEEELQLDPALRAELEKLRLADRQILAAYPPDQAIPQILKKAARTRKAAAAPRRRLAWVALPVLGLALLMLVLLPPLLKQRLGVGAGHGSGDYIGVKGSALPAGPALQVFRQSDGAKLALQSGDSARAGDLLQLAYLPGKESHGVILSIDGWGRVTLHFPDAAGGSTMLAKGQAVPLPRAFELDDAPRFERFFFITAGEELPAEVIMEQARKLASDPERAMSGRLDLPGRFRQSSFLVRK